MTLDHRLPHILRPACLMSHMRNQMPANRTQYGRNNCALSWHTAPIGRVKTIAECRTYVRPRGFRHLPNVSLSQLVIAIQLAQAREIFFRQCRNSQQRTFPRQRDSLMPLVVACWLWEAQNIGSEPEVQKSDSGLMGHSCFQQMDH